MTHVPLADAAAETDPQEPTSLDASDEFELPTANRYCPTQLLGSFTLLMAGHGRCVSSAMMLGDREYAMWQLARAQTLPDEALHVVAQRLFAYFDDPRVRAAHRTSV
ncbi:MAG TPA: hypothetical protein VFE82_16895 [Ramlibacter sp.]|jgi:hypothetical protein|uniref:hypothetical protein n=1 Tax=Ramlibacter sp. TaxID=1917967 RepID=UPI002D745FFA|nr:hypothetical protein [Ramlibacter sp.]HZY20150.1 hypothetical protein [Ramlibacter sp.]